MNDPESKELLQNRDLLVVALLPLVVGVLVSIIYGVNSIPAGDALTYASLARSLSEVGSLVHSSSLPSDVMSLGGFPDLDISQNPGYPFFLTPFMTVFSNGNLGLIVPSILLYSLNSVLTYQLAIQYFDRKTARLSAFIFIFSPAYYPYIYSGLAEPLIIACLLGSLCLYGALHNKRAIISGFLASAIFLTKSATFYFLVPFYVMFVIVFEKDKSRYLLSFISVILGIMIFNFMRQADTGLALVSEKSDLIDLVFYNLEAPGAWYDGLRALRLPASWMDPIKFIIENPGFYFERYARTFYGFYLGLFGLRLMFIGSVFTAIYMFSRLQNKKELEFRFSLLTLPTLLVIGFSIGWPIERYILPTLPLLLIAMSAGIYSSIRNKYLITLVVTIFVAPWVGFAIKDMADSSKPDYSKVGQIIREVTKQDDIIVTNSPGLIGWYGNRRSILYPTSVEDFVELKERSDEIKFLILTSDIYSLYRGSIGQLAWDNLFEETPKKLGGNLCLLDKHELFESSYRMVIYQDCGLGRE
jgi:4-amino-4-deoxy-L-arabinose transferase-like glycosyltransferase